MTSSDTWLGDAIMAMPIIHTVKVNLDHPQDGDGYPFYQMMEGHADLVGRGVTYNLSMYNDEQGVIEYR